MKKLLCLVSVLFVLFACNKDKYQSTPQIKIKSVSTDVVPQGGGLTVVLSFTDKEGDVNDSVFIRKIRLNQRYAPPLRDTIHFKTPDFPSHRSGEISIFLNGDNVKGTAQPPPAPGGTFQPDTMKIWFAITDKAGHKSDSVSTGTIVVLQ